MPLSVSLNKPHLARLGIFAVWWAIYLTIALIAGWRLQPRGDEILFVATLPLWLLVPYAVACFAIALIKLWAARWNWWRPGVIQGGPFSRRRIGL